jgi:hypothetical protein
MKILRTNGRNGDEQVAAKEISPWTELAYAAHEDDRQLQTLMTKTC